MRTDLQESKLFFMSDQRLALWHNQNESMTERNLTSRASEATAARADIMIPADTRAQRNKTQNTDRKIERSGRIVSLSPGAPVHCPAPSGESEPGPPRRPPAAANTESSSSQHPGSSHLPLLTPEIVLLKLKKSRKTVNTVRGLCK